MSRSPEQVKVEIARLLEMKPNVRHFSGFGDDHHAAIDGQVRVLQENLSENRIYDIKDEAEAEAGGDSEAGMNVLDSMLEARRWLDGETEAPPSKDWESLWTPPAPPETKPKRKPAPGGKGRAS